ncbi:MAG: hypothetical protein IKY16_10035, partial [Bacteroidales bacterium]|nr:hypothetical protein [Bacteroidales bacterium]
DHYFAETDFGRLPRRNKDGKFDEEDIRKKLEKLNSVLEVSMEDMMTYQDGEYHEDRDARFATDPFEQMCYSRQVRDEQNLRLLVPFIRELMNYPDEPQKPLALMYGMILFQITQACGGHDAISKAAQKSTKKRSAAWAHRRMGNLTLESLGDKSEMVVRHQYDQALAWGDSFRQYMLRTLADGTNRTWSEIVYTKTYTEAQTSNWIESITESTRKKCARMYAANPDLREIAVQKSNNALRKYMEKIEKKEACR